MIKRSFSVLLILLLLCGAVLSACQNTPTSGGETSAAFPSEDASEVTDGETTDEPEATEAGTLPEESSGEDPTDTSLWTDAATSSSQVITPSIIPGTMPATDTTTATDVVTSTDTTGAPGTTDMTEPSEPKPVVKVDPTVPGTLIYREDFEDCALTNGNSAVLKALGWEILNKEDGAYSNHTATYRIVDRDGSRALEITNFTDTVSGKDSYVQILSSLQFGYLSQQSYTYQYDFRYTSASDDKRYIALVSSYDGRFYNSFHLRNGGAFNNECHTEGEWKKYAVAGDAKPSLGVSGSSLNGYSVSIRYVVDWEKGCKIYGRLNGGASSAWVLLSEFDKTQNGNAYFDPAIGGSALVLKVGGAQNGTIDNIMVWSGTMEAPIDQTAKPYLSSDDRCHRMMTVKGTEICTLCGKTQAQIDSAWLLSDVPAYVGGTPSQKIYLSGQGLDPDQPLEKEDRMQIIAETSETEFASYMEKLRVAGYTREMFRTVDGNRFASYVYGKQRVYAYFISEYKEARVIVESTEVSASVSAFGYSYTKKSGDTTVLYQYALPLRDATHFKGNNYVDRGMLYVVKLADNKVVIFDGGESVQFTDARIDDLMAFLREITGVGENGTVTIAAWYLTHAHQDHVQGFFALARKYSEYLTLERVFYNIPSYHSENTTVQGVNNSVTRRMLGYIEAYFGDDNVQFLKVHTGQIIRLADVTFEILYTHEDLVDPRTAETEVGSNYNESSSVVKLTFDGTTAMITGDIDTKAAGILMRYWSKETLKVEILQLAHHVLNNLTDLYHLIQAPILLVPQSAYRIEEHGTARPTFAVAKQYADEGMIFFENGETVGLQVVGGVVKRVYTRPILYESVKFYWPDP